MTRVALRGRRLDHAVDVTVAAKLLEAPAAGVREMPAILHHHVNAAARAFAERAILLRAASERLPALRAEGARRKKKRALDGVQSPKEDDERLLSNLSHT